MQGFQRLPAPVGVLPSRWTLSLSRTRQIQRLLYGLDPAPAGTKMVHPQWQRAGFQDLLSFGVCQCFSYEHRSLELCLYTFSNTKASSRRPLSEHFQCFMWYSFLSLLSSLGNVY